MRQYWIIWVVFLAPLAAYAGGVGDSILRALEDPSVLEVVIGIVVALLGAFKVSKDTIKQIDDILETWGPKVVRATRQTMYGIDDVTGEQTEPDALNRTDRNREMRDTAIKDLTARVPAPLRATARVIGVDVAGRAATSVESNVNDLKAFDAVLAAKKPIADQ